MSPSVANAKPPSSAAAAATADERKEGVFEKAHFSRCESPFSSPSLVYRVTTEEWELSEGASVHGFYYYFIKYVRDISRMENVLASRAEAEAAEETAAGV